MSFLDVLEALTIGPLKLVFETIFSIANRVMGHPGIAIIALSLIMNILVLPLYRQADAMQEKARDTDAKLRDGVAHIKKAFSGDERMMILQTYYRQNHYRPTDALSGSISLLLEIPFFMAAYQFLAHAEILNGVALGPIRDLGAPDGLLVISGLAINLLPIIMTAVNCVSSALYLKDFPLKTKIQLYGMALFFLVFLYNSPSGLVFYWTLNNLFSLVKTIFYKLKNPRKVLCILLFGAGLGSVVLGLLPYQECSIKRRAFFLMLGAALVLPLILSMGKVRRSLPLRKTGVQPVSDAKAFWLGALFLTVLTGVLIPSAVIGSSPQEFMDVTYFYHPLWYIANALCLSAGTFLVWMGVFYWLADSRWKIIFQRLVWILCGVMLVNYLFFGTNLGTLTPFLQYQGTVLFSSGEQLVNLLVVAAVALVLYLFFRKFGRRVVPVLLTALVAIGSMSVVNMVQIRQSVNQALTGDYTERIQLPLSKNGKNVVVLMLDRAMGEYIPYLFNEKPELAEKFDGFTYYPNTVSFGGYTIFGVPPLVGGYEYTPVELNRRADQTLVTKHNEALKVMPTLFADNGYDVTVCDPPYAGYQWIPDLSIYSDDARIQAYITKGMYLDDEQKEQMPVSNRRNFFLFSIMKTLPLLLQNTIYDSGNYNQVNFFYQSSQVLESSARASGAPTGFLQAYTVMENLPNLTNVTDSDTNTFLFLSNDVTHDTALLQTPEYVPSEIVDNTAYDAANTDRFTIDGRTLDVDDPVRMQHYHSNMAAMLTLADWFDYLRENDVYDNTRIILVSDHGRTLQHIEEMIVTRGSETVDLEAYLPLLMVKDFGAHGFETSDAFMTNADVPALAAAELIKNPVNPFTGKPITSDEKTAHEQFIIRSGTWKAQENSGNTFRTAQWLSVKGNPWDLSNWTFYDTECVLDRHAAP